MTKVVTAILKRGDRYLIGKRRIDQPFGGLWEFPGGKIEEGESHFEALRRELLEELYIGRVNFQLFPIWEGIDPTELFYISFYEVMNYDDFPVLHEHDGLIWETKEEILRRTDLINDLMKTVTRLLK